MNKVGDLALVLALILLFLTFHNTEFDHIFFNLKEGGTLYFFLNFFIGSFYISFCEIICFFFFCGAVAKSAQIGLHT